MPPHALDGTGDHDNGERGDGTSGNDLVAGLAGCDGRVGKRLCKERIFAGLSLPTSGETEVKRKLDWTSMSPMSNTDRPKPVGTPVR
jgi:hypothetical protein